MIETMTIQYCSDLHLEFPENKLYILENPIEPKAEILILAGDIVPFALLHRHQDFFDNVSQNFKYTFWIAGNHEYYHSDIRDRSGSFEEKIRENVFLLNNKVKEIEGVRLIFSTLWTNISSDRQFLIQRSLSDFRVIENGSRLFTAEDYNLLHKENVQFLEEALNEPTDSVNVVVTHHVPTFQNYPEKYLGSAINEAFAVDVERLMIDCSIKYWIYGHHHSNRSDFTIGNTKLVTNQLGYVRHKENIGYNTCAVLEM